MKVYKFGGASVRDAAGVRNLAEIVRGEAPGGLLVVVSAMGKSTNALEGVVEALVRGDGQDAAARIGRLRDYHRPICGELFAAGEPAGVTALWSELEQCARDAGKVSEADYGLWYDRIVPYGELISTAIVAAFLVESGIPAHWCDMRRCLVTDTRHRDANVDLAASAPLLQAVVAAHPGEVVVGQGFIGATPGGEPTTLGREGSDYSAAVAAHILDAESVTIWKDVEGILNADPKIFPDAVHIPELTYLDVIELAYSGAQIIHPKTIKPLQNKSIPLYVRPFGDASRTGSVVRGEMAGNIDVPIRILKRGQVLVSIRPKDFSFVLEDRLGEIFSMLEGNQVKINLIQSSAVNLTVCVDRSRTLEAVLEQLRGEFRVVTNDNAELLTVRGYTPELYRRYAEDPGVLVLQRTRRIMRLVRIPETV